MSDARERRNHTHPSFHEDNLAVFTCALYFSSEGSTICYKQWKYKKLTKILNFLILIFLDLEQDQGIAWRDKSGGGFRCHGVYAPSGSFAFHKINRDSNENVAYKKEFEFLPSLFNSDYSYPLTLSNLANPPEGDFQVTIFKLRKRNKISSLLAYVLHKTRI